MDPRNDDLFNKVKQEVIDIINANKELDQQVIDVLLLQHFEKSATTQRNTGEWVVLRNYRKDSITFDDSFVANQDYCDIIRFKAGSIVLP